MKRSLILYNLFFSLFLSIFFSTRLFLPPLETRLCALYTYCWVQASDGGSTTASTSGVPLLNNGPTGLCGSLSPVSCVPSNSGPATPAPSPAPAALPPPSLPPPYQTTPLQVRNSILVLHNFHANKERKRILPDRNCVVDYSCIFLPRCYHGALRWTRVSL